MATRNPRPQKRVMTDVDLALAALDGNPNPMDMDTRDIDPDPTSLDLPEGTRITGDCCHQGQRVVIFPP